MFETIGDVLHYFGMINYIICDTTHNNKGYKQTKVYYSSKNLMDKEVIDEILNHNIQSLLRTIKNYYQDKSSLRGNIDFYTEILNNKFHDCTDSDITLKKKYKLKATPEFISKTKTIKKYINEMNLILLEIQKIIEDDKRYSIYDYEELQSFMQKIFDVNEYGSTIFNKTCMSFTSMIKQLRDLDIYD